MRTKLVAYFFPIHILHPLATRQPGCSGRGTEHTLHNVISEFTVIFADLLGQPQGIPYDLGEVWAVSGLCVGCTFPYPAGCTQIFVSCFGLGAKCWQVALSCDGCGKFGAERYLSPCSDTECTTYTFFERLGLRSVKYITQREGARLSGAFLK